MAATQSDFQLAAVAAGFTLGFGFLTVWEAIKQTKRNKNPLRSVYIYMLWGEIVVNLVIGIIGWTFLHGNIGPTVPVLFFILFCWVFEIQLLMQIIVNRIALIAEHRSTVRKLKWGSVAVITAINIAVFIIWIPAHTVPPAAKIFVDINNIWDKISKVLILLVDAGLNWYFLKTVEQRLVQQNGLVKYKPLVGFNAKLMVVSIAMDGMLIGLMFLKNPVVYIQFHPVVYMVKLNIEMSMASLVVRLARGKSENDMDMDEFDHTSSGHGQSSNDRSKGRFASQQLQSFQHASATGNANPKGHTHNGSDEDFRGIHFRTDFQVVSEEVDNKKGDDSSSSKSSAELPRSVFGDETPLKNQVQAATIAL